MRCNRLNATISESVCVLRQDKAISGQSCYKCPQGEKVKTELGTKMPIEEVKPQEQQKKTRKPWTRKPVDPNAIKQQKLVVTLNFTNYSHLHNKLEQEALNDFRTLEQQILYILSQRFKDL